MSATAGSRNAALYGGLIAALAGAWLVAVGLANPDYMLGKAWIVGSGILVLALSMSAEDIKTAGWVCFAYVGSILVKTASNSLGKKIACI